MQTSNLIGRVKSILLAPRTEWPVIAAETDTVAGLYTGYILILSAIPAVRLFLTLSMIGQSNPFAAVFSMSPLSALTAAVTGYVLSLIGVFVVALIVDALAPTFGAQRNRVQALKTVAYSYTASWIASIIGIVPGLGLVAALVGLGYGLYLLNLGLPFTMKCPPEKAIGYTIVTVIAAIVVSVLLSYFVHVVGGVGFGMGSRLNGTSLSPTTGAAAPGTSAAGVALQDWSRRMADASKQVDNAQKSGDWVVAARWIRCRRRRSRHFSRTSWPA